MKLFTTILSAALIAGASTVAMAQGAGGSVNPDQVGRGADTNPSAPNANPMAGNQANTMQSKEPQMRNGMSSSDVSATPPAGNGSMGGNSSGHMNGATGAQTPTGGAAK